MLNEEWRSLSSVGEQFTLPFFCAGKSYLDVALIASLHETATWILEGRGGGVGERSFDQRSTWRTTKGCKRVQGGQGRWRWHFDAQEARRRCHSVELLRRGRTISAQRSCHRQILDERRSFGRRQKIKRRVDDPPEAKLGTVIFPYD